MFYNIHLVFYGVLHLKKELILHLLVEVIDKNKKRNDKISLRFL